MNRASSLLRVLRTVTPILAWGAISATCLAHDMFLVVPDHDIATESQVTISLYNGTFDKSENVIDRDRMLDVSVVDGQGLVSHPELEQWREEGNITLLDLQTGSPGTYVVGLSTATKMIELTAEEFDDYLAHDGVIDVLEARRSEGAGTSAVSERYSKHVKMILQVGAEVSDSYKKPLGYPIEIVPLANPGSLAAGDALEVLVLRDGDPVADQLIYASYEGYHSHDETGTHREAFQTRTNEAGKARIELSRAGRWYLRLIRMVPVAEEEADYESNWTTLTFEIGS